MRTIARLVSMVASVDPTRSAWHTQYPLLDIYHLLAPEPDDSTVRALVDAATYMVKSCEWTVYCNAIERWGSDAMGIAPSSIRRPRSEYDNPHRAQRALVADDLFEDLIGVSATVARIRSLLETPPPSTSPEQQGEGAV